jgi:hypothetical protein
VKGESILLVMSVREMALGVSFIIGRFVNVMSFSLEFNKKP